MSEHSTEHDAADYDDVHTRSLVLIGLITTILVFVAIVAVQTVYFRYEASELQEKVIDRGDLASGNILAAQREQLEGIGPPANEGETLMPISQAMEQVLVSYEKQAPRTDASEPAQEETTKNHANEEPAAEAEASTDAETDAPQEEKTVDENDE